MIKITPVSDVTAPVTRVRVDGRIVLRTAGEVAKACGLALDAGKPVLLDLGGVGFVDAEGAHAIAALERRNVTVVGCSPFVGALLRSHEAHAAEAESGSEEDDRELVVRLRRHDPSACEELVRRYGGRTLAVAERILGNHAGNHAGSRATAGDVVHEAFLTAFERVGDLDGRTSLAAWLRGIVAHAAVTRLRTQRRGAEESLDALLPRFDATGHWADGVTALPIGSVSDAGVRRGIDRLPDAFRVALLLCDVERLDVFEVAALLGTTADAVKSRLHRARQVLRTVLAQQGAAEGADDRIVGAAS